MNRCPWCTCNEKMIRYHDEEWGVPLHDDQKQFEFLMMEVMQCGLNWNMMIQKREVFRECFAEFDFDKVAEYGEEDIERIMNTEGMIRSRRKIEAVIHNARCFQKIRDRFFQRIYLGLYKGKDVPLYRTPERRDPCAERSVRQSEQRSEETRDEVYGLSHRLLPSAGMRDHQRPYGILFPVSAAFGNLRCSPEKTG